MSEKFLPNYSSQEALSEEALEALFAENPEELEDLLQPTEEELNRLYQELQPIAQDPLQDGIDDLTVLTTAGFGERSYQSTAEQLEHERLLARERISRGLGANALVKAMDIDVSELYKLQQGDEYSADHLTLGYAK